MPNRNYERGRRFEWRVRDLLRKDGWTVLRTAGSKGPVDLIAIHPGIRPLWFVQAKTRRPTLAECNKAVEFAAVLGDRAVLWLVWPGTRRGVIEWECVHDFVDLEREEEGSA